MGTYYCEYAQGLCSMRDKILEILKHKKDYISGEEMSHSLAISRQALWKHIQELKEAGYDLVAVPHLGYKLVSCPDRLFPAEVGHGLRTKFVGKKIYYFENVNSTMDLGWDLGMKGAPEGTIILAESQAKGRGRLGRNWLSPKYKGIYFSLILRPQIAPQDASVLTLMAAVSICEAIKEIVDVEAQIKWPNDILIQHKKIGGILTELNSETDRVHFVVIGIGLNVNNDKKTLVEGATSLKEISKESVNRVELLKSLLARIEVNYHDFLSKKGSFIVDRWRDYNVTLGKRVKVLSSGGSVEGQALDIDNDGGLLIRNDAGLIQKVFTGDVVHCR